MTKKAAPDSQATSAAKVDLKARRLFGTDGIRGTANVFPMTPDVVMRVGQAMGHLLRRQPKRNAVPKVVIG